jgi:outer membrane protein assembly factor BamB
MGDKVIVNSHTIGMRCFKISKDTGGLKAEEAWANKDLKINLASPVLVDGHIYIMGPARDYVCVDADTGALKWSQPGFGLGRKDYASTIVVGKTLMVLTEDGTLVIVEPNPSNYTELARLQVCGNTWAFPALAGGKLYVRDGRQLVCLDLNGPNKT